MIEVHIEECLCNVEATEYRRIIDVCNSLLAVIKVVSSLLFHIQLTLFLHSDFV